MTNKESREILQQIRKQKCVSECDYDCPLYKSKTVCLEEKALDMAIKALEQQPITWIVGKDNCQVAVRNMPIDKMQKICAIIEEEEQQPCEDCISREAVIKHLENITMDTNPDHYDSKDKWYQANGFNLCKVGIEMYVADLPSVTPKQKVGEWIFHYRSCSYICSECGSWLREDSNYCPNCGARMEVKQDDN